LLALFFAPFPYVHFPFSFISSSFFLPSYLPLFSLPYIHIFPQMTLTEGGEGYFLIYTLLGWHWITIRMKAWIQIRTKVRCQARIHIKILGICHTVTCSIKKAKTYDLRYCLTEMNKTHYPIHIKAIFPGYG
jgi:hypothetical protein